MKRALFRIAAVLCIALAAFFLMPVFGGILHFGMIWPAAVLLPAAAVLLRPDFFRRLLRPRWLRRAVSLLAAVCAAAVLVTLGMMARAAGNRPPEDMPCTVIVLGCQVLEDGRPSLMLQKRIDAANDMLKSNKYLIKEIAADCGFSSVAQFCTKYREVMGITPKQMQQKRAEDARDIEKDKFS